MVLYMGEIQSRLQSVSVFILLRMFDVTKVNKQLHMLKWSTFDAATLTTINEFSIQLPKLQVRNVG